MLHVFRAQAPVPDAAVIHLRKILLSLVVSMTSIGVPRAPAGPADLRPWTDYRAIMWVGNSAYKQPQKTALFFQRLREMGINAATVHATAGAEPLVANGFPFYVENIVNRGLCLKFNSKVRDWDAFITTWSQTARPDSALVRDYCLDDAEWRDWARAQMQAAVRRHVGHAPFAYDIRDELSTTISANPFDYDFGPAALAAFRAWLKTQYTDLAALNAQWQTSFAGWDEVRPFTTDEIKRRMSVAETRPSGAPDWAALRRLQFDPERARAEPTRWNFAPWADFRTYMDVALARTLGELRTAARELDPVTPVGIEGTQMPSAFGGYDLWRLSQVLDWVEPYDIGNAREILGSFMPGKPILTTVFEKDTPHASRRLWHLLLEGDRGCIVWWSEDCIDWKSDDYGLTAKARALAPVLREMQSPLAQLFLRAERETDPVYFVYSQPSIQVDWLLESTADGPTWIRRFSSFEARHNRLAQKRASWVKLFQDLGYTPQFVPAERIRELPSAKEGGVLLLADALALSAEQAQAAAEFCTRNGAPAANVLLIDGAAGVFDQHGRLQASPGPLGRHSAHGAISVSREATVARHDRDIAVFGRQRLKAAAPTEWYEWADAQLRRRVPVLVRPEARTRVHRYRLGDARLVAFERNINYHMSEVLRQAGGNEALELPIDVEARLPAPAHVYELPSGRYAGHSDRFTFTLDPWRPSLFALLREKIDGDILTVLQRKTSMVAPPP